MNNRENSNMFKNLGFVILSVCMLAIGFSAGRLIDFDPNTAIRRIAQDKPDLGLFWDVYNVMQRRFVGPEDISFEELQYGAIKGLVNAFGDPATIFLTPEETETFQRTTQGKYFEGIGAELGYEDGNIIVVTPLDGSPAKEAGVRPGDYILAVDGNEVRKGDNIYEVVEMIRGEAGTKVVLTVLHRGDMEVTDIEIVRGEITIPSMSLDFKEGDIAYIDIARFTDSGYSAWTSLWDEIVDEVVSSGTDKIIVDLRGNPGGYFNAAIYAADEFLNDRKVISMQEDGSGRRTEFTSKNGGRFTDKNVVVLVNSGSASASEILSGALQYYGIATIVGETTYGKGTAQAIEDFRNGSSLHITVSKWLLPDGQWINRDNPIEPDFEVELSTEDFRQGLDPQLDKAIELLNK